VRRWRLQSGRAGREPSAGRLRPAGTLHARRPLLQLPISIGSGATSRTNHDERNSDDYDRGHDQHDHGQRTAGLATDRHAPVSSHGPIIPPTPPGSSPAGTATGPSSAHPWDFTCGSRFAGLSRQPPPERDSRARDGLRDDLGGFGVSLGIGYRVEFSAVVGLHAQPDLHGCRSSGPLSGDTAHGTARDTSRRGRSRLDPPAGDPALTGLEQFWRLWRGAGMRASRRGLQPHACQGRAKCGPVAPVEKWTTLGRTDGHQWGENVTAAGEIRWP
jgi:hypothetical protein